jgi:hypothetical protein
MASMQQPCSSRPARAAAAAVVSPLLAAAAETARNVVADATCLSTQQAQQASDSEPLKMVLCVNQSLKMGKGKIGESPQTASGVSQPPQPKDVICSLWLSQQAGYYQLSHSNIAIGPAPHRSGRRKEHSSIVLASVAVIQGMNNEPTAMRYCMARAAHLAPPCNRASAGMHPLSVSSY